MKLSRLFLITASMVASPLTGCGDDDPADLPLILGFESSRSAISAGEAVVLSWSVENASKVSITAAPGGSVLEGGTELSGSFETGPLEVTTKFTLRAENSEGASTRELTVTIDDTTAAILSFTANPNPGRLNGRTTLQWVTTRATQVRVLRGSEVLLTETTSVDSGTFEVPLPTETNEFTLEARNETTVDTRALTVDAEVPPVIRRFDVSPLFFVGESASVSIAWETENAAQLTLEANGVPVPGFSGAASGSLVLVIEEDTIFVLLASSGGGRAEESRTVVRTIGEAEPNDELGTATSLGAGGGVSGAIEPDSDVDYYSVTVPAGYALHAETSDGNGGCATDTVLALLNASGDVLTSDDNGGATSSSGSGACSRIDPKTDLQAAELTAGTYYLRVSAYEAGPYHLLVQLIPPGCGNGVWEAGRGEQCDDGNSFDDDGCSAACELEIAGMLTGPPAAQVFSGTAEALQYSFYVLQITSPAYVNAKLYSPSAPDCPIDFAELALFDAQGVEQTYDFRVDGCPHIDPNIDPYAYLTPGLYVLGIGFYGDAGQTYPYSVDIQILAANICGNGVVETGEHCDDGNNQSGDGCDAQCRVEARGTLSGPPSAQIFTDTAPGDLLHFYALTLSTEAYVEAAIFAPTVPDCQNGADPVLYLTDPNLLPLGYDDDSGPEACAHLYPAFTENARLAAGQYFVAAGFRGVASQSFDYQVRIALLPVDICGNGVAEGNEQCDDGNVAGGDGCSAACDREVSATINPPGGVAFVNPPSAIAYQTVQVNITQGGQTLTATTSSGSACEADNRLELYDADLVSLLGAKTSGDSNLCGEITIRDEFAANLPVGAYHLVLRPEGGGVGPHRIRVEIQSPACGNGRIETNAGEQCDDSNLSDGDGCDSSCQFEGPVLFEAEPNDSIASANDSGAIVGLTQTIAGRIYPIADADFYQFTIPGGAPRSLVATTYTQFGDPTICDNIDTGLWLYDAAGALVAENDDSGAVVFTTCSELSEASLPGRGLDALAPGTYYLEVRRYLDRQTIRQYLLDIRLD